MSPLFLGSLGILATTFSEALGGLLMLGTVKRYLPVKEHRVAKVGLFLLFYITIGMPSWIGDENVLFLFPAFFAFFLLCCQGSRPARVALSMVFYAVLMPWNILVDSLGLGGELGWQALPALGAKLLVWAGLWLLVRRVTPAEGVRLSRRMWLLTGGLSLGPVCVMLTFSIWGWSQKLVSYDTFHSVARPLAFTFLPFALLTGVALLLAVAVLARQEALERENRLAQSRELYYQSLRREQEQIRTLRHDMANHLTALQGLLEGARPDEALSYLHSLSHSAALTGGQRFCEHEAANALLSSKADAARRAGLEPDFQADLSTGLPMGDPDLCALLGNALDNAIDNAAGAEDPVVLLRARVERGLFLLRVENAFAGSREQTGDLFPTTKEDKSQHGLGLRAMRDLALQRGGSFEASAQNHRFQLIVCLPLF